MAFTANGEDLFEATVTLPRVGVWTCDLIASNDVSGSLATGSSVTVDLDGLELTGTVTRGGVTRNTQVARIVGGVGGLSQTCAAGGYVQASLQQVVGALLTSLGETLSPTVPSSAADQAALTTVQPLWMVFAEPGAAALTRLAEAAGVTWRVLTDGTVWLGTDSYAPVTLANATLMSASPELGLESWGIASPALLPGTALAGSSLSGLVSNVTYDLQPGRYRMRVLFDDSRS